MKLKRTANIDRSGTSHERADIVIRSPEGPLTRPMKSITDRASAERAISRLLDSKPTSRPA